ncbi:hypothetical protein Nepgr_021590 [Nepenthes gracilis]|uniref:Uncharacterized protein n=1 Tax=Nepenthes gracilis TaxID=150966 RepID=A0AAD3SYX6_NEPGR|nr:hypothetical protein Nepgr_021590 [Nepenthes gracilis]
MAEEAGERRPKEYIVASGGDSGADAAGDADMPGFIGEPGSYPAYFRMCLKQFSNLNEADFVLVNTCYELEAEVRD